MNLLVLGCGPLGSGTRTLHPAKGKLTLANGSPLTSGLVGLEPNGSGNRCVGKINSNGTFELQTGDEKGAAIGKYKAYVFFPAGKGGKSTMPVSAKGIPKKYLESDSTDLEIEITGGDNELVVNLK